MFYINRLFKYLLSEYSNNNKFNYSLYGYLRIFFERNNKFNFSFLKLGNIFKNTKWTDFKIQNIKNLFLRFSFVILIGSIFIIFVSMFITGGNLPSYNDNNQSNNNISYTISYIWYQFSNVLEFLYLAIFSLFYKLKTRIKTYMSASILSNDKTTNVDKCDVDSTKIFNLSSIKLPEISGIINNISNKKLSIKCNFNLFKLNDILLDLNFFYKNSRSDTDYHSIFNNKTPLDNQFNCTNLISSIESKYVSILTKPNFVNTSVNLSYLNKLQLSNNILMFSNLNIYKNLENLKQERWLMKNSLLSEKLVINSNSFTQIKKILGLNVFNTNVSFRNIWLSNKISNFSNIKELDFISNLQKMYHIKNNNTTENLIQNSYNNSSMININFFENSRLWLSKKYFYSNVNFNNNLFNSVYPLSYKTTKQSNIIKDYLFLIETGNLLFYKQTDLLYISDNFYQASSIFSKNMATGFPYDFLISNLDNDLFSSNDLLFLNKIKGSNTSQNTFMFFSLIDKDIFYISMNLPEDITIV